MNKDRKVVEIMVEIAIKEEIKLKRALLLSLPVIFFLTFTLCLSFKQVSAAFIGQESLKTTICSFKYDKQVGLLLREVWYIYKSDVEQLAFMRFWAALIALILLVHQERIFAIPGRIREITRYKKALFSK